MNNKSNTLNRRNFLRFTAGMSIALGLDRLIPAYAKPVVAANEPKSRGKYSDLIDLQIQKTKLPIAGKNTSTLTVNGSIPGSLVRLKEGQTATINVTNNLDEDTSLHWHGLIVPREMDGVPGISYAGMLNQEKLLPIVSPSSKVVLIGITAIADCKNNRVTTDR